jgi:hypothetical protein
VHVKLWLKMYLGQWAQHARLVSGVPGVDGHPGNDNGSAGCRPAADRALAE